MSLTIGLSLSLIIVGNYDYLIDQISPKIINLGYNLLYGVSVCQIQINKVTNMLVPYMKYLKNNNVINPVIKHVIVKIIDKNCNVDNIICVQNATDLKSCLQLFDENNHEGVFIFDKNHDLGYINKIYYEQIPSTIDYKESTVNFMATEIDYRNVKYLIGLKNEVHNYYIVNNSLNQNFFKYYLKNELNLLIDDDTNFDYTVKIIDDNANLITLLPYQSIIFNQLDYTILSDKVEPDIVDDKPDIVDEKPDIVDSDSDTFDEVDSDTFIKID